MQQASSASVGYRRRFQYIDELESNVSRILSWKVVRVPVNLANRSACSPSAAVRSRSCFVLYECFRRDDGSRSRCIVGQMFACRVPVEVGGEESARCEGGVEMGMVRGREPNGLAGGATHFKLRQPRKLRGPASPAIAANATLMAAAVAPLH